MRLLVDTHILLWHLEDDPRLPVAWSSILENPDHQKYVSVASLWEIAIKTNIGSLTIQYPLDRIIPADCFYPSNCRISWPTSNFRFIIGTRLTEC